MPVWSNMPEALDWHRTVSHPFWPSWEFFIKPIKRDTSYLLCRWLLLLRDGLLYYPFGALYRGRVWPLCLGCRGLCKSAMMILIGYKHLWKPRCHRVNAALIFLILILLLLSGCLISQTSLIHWVLNSLLNLKYSRPHKTAGSSITVLISCMSLVTE